MVGVRGEGGEEMVSNVAMEVGGGGVYFRPLHIMKELNK
jgi:hypothetical protein